MNNSIEERSLALLGSGVSQEAVANALGVTPSYISQLLSDEEFARQVTQLRYDNLTKHTARDSKYDGIEDRLVEKLESAIPLLMRPGDILGAIKIINAAKRRGVDSPDASITNNNIVQITMPTAIVQKFTTNIHNQVVSTGEQDLLTIQSGKLKSMLETKAIESDNPKQEEVIEATIEENEILASL